MLSKKEVFGKIQRFVIEHKHAPTTWRSELVRQLTDELSAAGCPQSAYWTLKMRHPALLRKSAKLHTIGDILADFIMNIDEVAERRAEYPVHGPEREYREDIKRVACESSLVTERTEEYEAGTVLEVTFNVGNPVETALFGESVDMTAAELTARLTEIQRNPDGFINGYADGSAWNRKETVKRRTPENVREAIRRLDMRRVRTCLVCKNAFYSHSKQPGRAKICDIAPHPDKPGKYVCQVKRDQMLAATTRKTGRKVAA
ncbi:hypothetical protein D3C81_1136670 [compost metagenome]